MYTDTQAPTAAQEAAARAYPMFGRLRDMLNRAESACCDNRVHEMCGELEDLERTVGVVLRGGAGAHGGAG